jgi:hypothetical protein
MMQPPAVHSAKDAIGGIGDLRMCARVRCGAASVLNTVAVAARTTSILATDSDHMIHSETGPCAMAEGKGARGVADPKSLNVVIRNNTEGNYDKSEAFIGVALPRYLRCRFHLLTYL